MKPASPPQRTPRARREDAAFVAAAEVRRRAVASGVLVLTASVIVLFCCSRGERPAQTALAPSSSAGAPVSVALPPEGAPASAPASASGAPAGQSGRRVEPDASPEPAAAVRPPTLLGEAPAAGGSSSGGSRVGRAVADNDPRDLALLSRIERELGQPPSPAVHTILRRRREGAQRDELLGLARELPELPLRVLVIRWIDEVSPAP